MYTRYFIIREKNKINKVFDKYIVIEIFNFKQFLKYKVDQSYIDYV